MHHPNDTYQAIDQRFQQFFRNPRAQHTFIEVMRQSIAMLPTDNWGLTFNRRDVLLNVGMVHMLMLRRQDGMNEVQLLIDYTTRPTITESDDIEIHPADDPEIGWYRLVPGSTYVLMNPDCFDTYFPLLSHSYHTLLRKAMLTRLNPAAKRAHTPEVLAYLQAHR